MIYWITRLDAIQVALTVVVSVATVLIAVKFIVSLIKYVNAYDNPQLEHDKCEAAMKHEQKTMLNIPVVGKYMVIILAIWLCVSFVPTSKEAAAIYLIPKIANNEQVQKVPEQALRLLNVKLEQWIDDQIGTDAEKDTEQP